MASGCGLSSIVSGDPVQDNGTIYYAVLFLVSVVQFSYIFPLVGLSQFRISKRWFVRFGFIRLFCVLTKAIIK